MDRITEKQLRSLVDHINKLTGNAPAPYTHNSTGIHANIGNYFLEYAYNGINLVRMCSEGGGISQPLGGGFHTKRELYEKLHAFILGIETGKELKD